MAYTHPYLCIVLEVYEGELSRRFQLIKVEDVERHALSELLLGDLSKETSNKMEVCRE